MLHEHQVGLLAFSGIHHREAAGELHVFLDVVLAERRIGQHAVEAHQLAAFVQVLRLAQGVFLADVGMGDAVQQHVHLADGPGGAHLFLPVQRQLVGAATVLAQVVAHLDQHAAGAHGRVVDAHALLRVADLHAHAHHFGRGVELAGLLAGGVGEVFDQVLVGGAQQVGELEVLVLQRDLVEVLDEVDQSVVIQRALADLAVEVDVPLSTSCRASALASSRASSALLSMEPTFSLMCLSAGAGCSCWPFSYHFFPALVPAGARRHEEVFAGVLVWVFQSVCDIVRRSCLRP